MPASTHAIMMLRTARSLAGNLLWCLVTPATAGVTRVRARVRAGAQVRAGKCVRASARVCGGQRKVARDHTGNPQRRKLPPGCRVSEHSATAFVIESRKK
jgi:hypothetical protein